MERDAENLKSKRNVIIIKYGKNIQTTNWINYHINFDYFRMQKRIF